MRIASIEVSNFQRISAVSIHAQAPVIVIAGHNEAGKSSLLEAIRIAVTGDSTRIKLKKDWSEMLRDGAKGGSIAIDAGEAGSADINLKTWKRECNIDAQNENVLKILLDPAQFSAMSPAERRGFLFHISGATFSGKAVGEKMIARHAPPAMVEEILPMLRSGFPAAHETAKDKAKESRGAWKGVTGEVYGSAKATGWEAEKPECDEDTHNKLAVKVKNTSTEIESLSAEIATYKARQRAYDQLDGIGSLQAVVGKEKDYHTMMSEIVDQIRALEENAPEKAVDGTASLACPHCAGLCSLVSGTLLEYHEPSKKSRDKWAAHNAKLNQLKSDVRELDGKLTEVNQARNRIEALTKATVGFGSPPDYSHQEARLVELRDQRAMLTEQRDHEAELIRRASRADDDTTKADRYHEEVTQWEAVAEMLSPAGIPGEILVGAIKPFNKQLIAVSESTTWPEVTLDNDMEIRVGGRLYALASESAKWRADAALAYAVASITGVKFFALDRVDVLDVQNRATCMMWIHNLLAAGSIDGAILIGTFKEVPRLPESTFHTFWLEEGEIYADEEAVA